MKEIKLTLDHFDDGSAILKTEKGSKVLWPISLFPEEAKEGESIIFKIATETEKKEIDRGVAKSILNEILNTD